MKTGPLITSVTVTPRSIPWTGCGLSWIAVVTISLSIPQTLRAAEIVLRSGDVFVGDILREQDRETTFRWQDKTYSIPRRDIDRVDYGKTGKHVSYRYSNFVMRDGSTIRGVVAEETPQTITVKTELGFLPLERASIQSTDHVSGRIISPPETYLKKPVDVPQTILGGGPAFLANGPPVGRTHPFSAGVGLFVEPAFLEWRSFRIGYLLEYLSSRAQGRSYEMLGNTLYAGRELSLWGMDRAYFRVGAGLLQVSYRDGQDRFAGIDPLVLGELGRRFQYGGSVLSLGGRLSCAVESGAVPCMVGVVFGISVAL